MRGGQRWALCRPEGPRKGGASLGAGPSHHTHNLPTECRVDGGGERRCPTGQKDPRALDVWLEDARQPDGCHSPGPRLANTEGWAEGTPWPKGP